jgi:hypothetical protein
MDYNLQEGENGLKHISLPNIINWGVHKLIGTFTLNKKKISIGDSRELIISHYMWYKIMPTLLINYFFFESIIKSHNLESFL